MVYIYLEHQYKEKLTYITECIDIEIQMLQRTRNNTSLLALSASLAVLPRQLSPLAELVE